jgi:hypothetical protein
VAAGGSVTLNALIVDDAGSPATEPVDVEFFDVDGILIGQARSEHGVASIQYVPRASSPQIGTVEPITITVDGESVAGLAIHGSGFSIDATLTINGVPTTESGVVYEVEDASTILVVTDGSTMATVSVTNPGGATSNVVRL